MWGTEPWGNDRAADWYARLIGDSGFAVAVRQALQRVIAADYIDDEYYLVRAACHSLLCFGHVYVWPVNDLDSDLRLGLAATRRVMEEAEEEMQELLQSDIVQLETRLKSIGDSSNR